MNSADTSYQQIVNIARVALEAAGNPAYGIVIESGAGLELMPMVYANLKPAMGHAERLSRAAVQGEHIYLVSRQIGENQRVVFDVADDRGRKLHRQTEVIETSLADEDTLM